MAGRREARLDVVGGEVGRGEREAVEWHAQPVEPGALVGLRGRVVELEPAHARLGVAQAATVVARADGDQLGRAGGDGVDHHLVEEEGAGLEVAREGVVGQLEPGGHVGLQPLVVVGPAVVGRDPPERQPLGRDTLGGG